MRSAMAKCSRSLPRALRQASGSPAREMRSLRLPLASRGTAAPRRWSYPRERRPEVASAALEQLLNVGELELDIGRAPVVALAGEGRLLHVAQQGVHLLRREPPPRPHAAVAGHG